MPIMDRYNPKHKLLVQTLSVFFGFGSWIAMTGLWVELPYLTQKLPESWALGSFLTIMMQSANIGPLIYWYARSRKLCSEVAAIHGQMLIGTVACISLIFWWDVTMFIGGTERSIVLYLAAFGLSIVDCTSSVVFLPYMARFRAHHMTPYLIGEGLSGFLPSLVALAQGVTEENEEDCVSLGSNNNGPEAPSLEDDKYSLLQNASSINLHGEEPRFSANIFFVFLLLILLLSWIAFTLMDRLVICRGERIDLNRKERGDIVAMEIIRGEALLEKKKNDIDDAIEDNQRAKEFKSISTREYMWLLGLMCWGCFTTFGAMPSIQSYSCLPYGADTFFYSVTLAGLAYPAACTVGFFWEVRSLFVQNMLVIIGSGIGVYILVCGLSSPNPPFKEKQYGSIIMILSWVIYVAMISYMKTMVALELNDKGGNPAMFWCGFAQQFGAATGGALIFCVITFTNVFKQENKCD